MPVPANIANQLGWITVVLVDIIHDHVSTGTLTDNTVYGHMFIYELVHSQKNTCFFCLTELAAGYGIDRILHPRGLRLYRKNTTKPHSLENSILMCTTCMGAPPPEIDLRLEKRQKKSYF